ncbi:hypothetical protein M5689_003207 [Euphorbia peplus]|nr:hypothetical protein M5689_003207 [Euphorbia peplus]
MSDLEKEEAEQNPLLTKEEFKLLKGMSSNLDSSAGKSDFVLPNCPVYVDVDDYQQVQQETTPLFYSHCNLSSDFLDNVEPRTASHPSPEQLVKLGNQLAEMFKAVNSTMHTLDSHSKFLASTMAQADIVSQRIAKQQLEMEGAFQNLSVRIDSMCTYMKERNQIQEAAMREMAGKLDSQNTRIFAIQKDVRMTLADVDKLDSDLQHIKAELVNQNEALATIPGITMPTYDETPTSSDSPSSASANSGSASVHPQTS